MSLLQMKQLSILTITTTATSIPFINMFWVITSSARMILNGSISLIMELGYLGAL